MACDCTGWIEDREGNDVQLVPRCGDPPCYELLDAAEVRDQCGGARGVRYHESGTEPWFSTFRLQCVGEVD